MGLLWLFLLLLLTAVILNLLAGTLSETVRNTAGEEACALPFLLPAGLLMESMLPESWRRREAERLMAPIVMLHGPKAAAFHLQIHLADKCVHFWMGMLLTSFLLWAGGVEFVWGLLLLPGGVAMYLVSDGRLTSRYKNRCRALSQAFPEFVSRLVLLLGAGMHLRAACVRLIREQGKDNDLYRELGKVLDDIEAGMAESQAWAELAERCRIRELSAFTGIIMQHLRLGGNRLVMELRAMTAECWENRKHLARRLGEEASSKLVFPLAIMFIAVLIVSVAPAFMMMGGFW